MSRWGGVFVEDRAKAVVEQARHLAGGRTSVDAAIAAAVQPALLAAFASGKKHGRAESASELSGVVETMVKKAIAKIRIEQPKCPDCSGCGCDDCNGTGKYE